MAKYKAFLFLASVICALVMRVTFADASALGDLNITNQVYTAAQTDSLIRELSSGMTTNDVCNIVTNEVNVFTDWVWGDGLDHGQPVCEGYFSGSNITAWYIDDKLDGLLRYDLYEEGDTRDTLKLMFDFDGGVATRTVSRINALGLARLQDVGNYETISNRAMNAVQNNVDEQNVNLGSSSKFYAEQISSDQYISAGGWYGYQTEDGEHLDSVLNSIHASLFSISNRAMNAVQTLAPATNYTDQLQEKLGDGSFSVANAVEATHAINAVSADSLIDISTDKSRDANDIFMQMDASTATNGLQESEITAITESLLSVSNQAAAALPLLPDSTANHALTAITIGSRAPRENQYQNYVSSTGAYSVVNGIDSAATTAYGHAQGYRTLVNATAAHAEGYATMASAYGAHAEGHNSRALGEYTISGKTYAAAIHSHVDGHCAVARHAYTYVWQGDNATPSQSWYYSHGDGTYNINPFGGLAGFYIGETNMQTILETAVLPIAENMSTASNALAQSILNESAAMRKVAMFIIPVNAETNGIYNGFEFKASTNNFSASTANDKLIYYAQSQFGTNGYQSAEVTCDKIKLFVCTSFTSSDARAYTPIESTLTWNHELTSVIVLIDASCLLRTQDASWLTEDNDNLIWCFCRTVGINSHEQEANSPSPLWRPIAPVRWYKTLPSWAR